ncbi:MAG: phosphoglycerate mutase family protein [Bacteroidota bacterium]
MNKKSLTSSLFLIAVTAFFGFHVLTNNEPNEEIYSIYLVRHTEKDLSKGEPGNPPLTQCGEERAHHLNAFLQDVKIEAIYSTDYTRTMSTANPTATAKNLDVQEYDPQKLEALAQILLEKEQNALVVGHSNTTGVLAGLLVGEEVGEIDLNVYNLIYQVNVHKGTSQLNQFQTSFKCEE